MSEETKVENSMENVTAANQNDKSTTQEKETDSTNVKKQETTNTDNQTGETTSQETTAITESNMPQVFGMNMPFVALAAIQVCISFALIIVVLQQSKTASSITASSYSSGGANTYWSKNKGRSKESKLSRLTIILGILFLVITFALTFID